MKIDETKNKLPKYITSVDSLYKRQCYDCNIIENISHGLFQ